MRLRALSAATLFVFPVASALAFGQGITLSQTPSRTDLHVQILYENDHPVEGKDRYQVHLLSSRSVPIANQATDDRGEAIFYSIGEGTYHVNVTGANIDAVEIQFNIFRGENSHMEFVHIRLKGGAIQQTGSTQGSVSSAALNIPDSARKEFDKGMTELEKQNFSAAQQRLSHATEIYPQYSLAFVNLGIIAMKQNHQDEGRHYFERAIAADPQEPAAYVHLAKLDIMKKKYSDAEPLLTKAISITPLNPEALMMLAASELYQGKLDEAIENAKRVHGVPHQQYAVAHLLAAQAYTQKDQMDRAADEYRLFLQESPNSASAAQARAALQSIENKAK